MRIKEITNYLESLAPLSTQESYDNCGLLVGDPSADVNTVLVSLDCIESTVDEAIKLGAEMIIAHHPIIFGGLKKLNGSNYVERTVLKAIKNDVAIYAIHTNLDNYINGVNAEIGKRMGLTDLKVLAPKTNTLVKIVCFVPEDYVESVVEAMYANGAGEIGNYKNCSFRSLGVGTFKPTEGASPFEGEVNELSTNEEYRLEVLASQFKMNSVIASMKEAHPYEEVAYEVYQILNSHQDLGSGMIGTLNEPMNAMDFMDHLKENFNCAMIRHTKLLNRPINKVAFCGGSGSFLLKQAISSKADVFVTGDFKYHEFFDAEDRIIIMDIGHYESEQFTSNRIASILTKKFPKFAVHLTEVNTNPINYY